MDSGLTYQALRDAQVDAALVFATDGRIQAFKFRVLTDDKEFFPNYAAVPVVRAEIHNRRDELQKVFDVKRLTQVSGIWTVREMVMTDTIQRTRTELVVEDVQYNEGLTAADFSRRALEQGGR